MSTSYLFDDVARTTVAPFHTVITSYLPLDKQYESIVIAPEAVRDAMHALRIPTESHYATRAEAEQGHQQVVTRVGMLLQAMKVAS